MTATTLKILAPILVLVFLTFAAKAEGKTSVDQYWSKVCGVVFETLFEIDNFATIAQLIRVLVWGARGPRFDSQEGRFFLT